MTRLKKKLLIVDNDEDWLSLLDRFLGAEGYSVTTAQDCAGAIKAAGLDKPDCVIVDLRLGREDGMSLCCWVKNNHLLSKIPVIMLSGLDGVNTGQGCGCACDAFVCKADGVGRLLSALKKCCPANNRP